MTFTEHLGELRIRIIYAGIAVVVAVVICYIFSNSIISVLERPITQHESQVSVDADDTGGEEAEPESGGVKLTAMNPLEPVFVKLKIAGYTGLLVSLPVVLYQICAFVFPGLRPKERRVIRILLVGCSCLAIVGVLVAYLGVLPLVLPYIMQWAPENWEIQLRANETLSIIIKFLVGFAIAFQFPMGVLILVYMDLLTPETLKRYRGMAVVGLAVGAAMLTPPDPGSMLIMLFPLVMLYEGSIWMSYLVRRRKHQAAAES